MIRFPLVAGLYVLFATTAALLILQAFASLLLRDSCGWLA